MTAETYQVIRYDGAENPTYLTHRNGRREHIETVATGLTLTEANELRSKLRVELPPGSSDSFTVEPA